MTPPSSLALATPRGGRPPTARQSRFRGGKLGRALQRSIGLVALVSASAIAEEPASPLGLWRIDQAQREPIYDRTQARLEFGTEGRLTGHTGCKPMIASYTLEAGKLHVGPVRTGSARCSAQQLEQEDRILTALETASSVRVRDDGLLELRDTEGRGVLRGTRFEPGTRFEAKQP